MAQTIRDIVKAMNLLAPPALAMEWDAVGLQVGSMNDTVKTIFVALDLTEKSLEEALIHDPQLIITHHPFIFSPLKHLRTDQTMGKMIQALMHQNVSVFAAHTNMDIAQGGLNDWVAQQLELQQISLLELTNSEPLLKLVVFVPETGVDQVADALAAAGAGYIGNYSHCSFRGKGTGTFKPLEGSNPTIGKQNHLEQVAEIRLETVLPARYQKAIIQAMKEAHPYEEVAYDLLRLENPGFQDGLGRLGYLKESMSPATLTTKLKEIFQLTHLRWVKGKEDQICRVAIVTGSGASVIKEAAATGCDALVTGDIKYHDAQLAESLGLHLFDVGHFESEQCFVPLVTRYLQQTADSSGWSLEIIPARSQSSPLQTV
ncbi:Nif3-like dinuclear metal center hexameric protein [Anoxynatronum sibiricum]|uniref:GTP cyclohydrolase 1 type 2 homolog n=1 Tax=Anoxynatronum sibiricum TaxID=210623 RepID=A0ABU9VUI9_9CLOT